MTAEELANPAMTHLERARAVAQSGLRHLCSSKCTNLVQNIGRPNIDCYCLRSLAQDLAALLAQVTNEATAERDATITALKSENEKLREALDALLVRWEECLPSIQNAEKIAHIHGWKYSGPEGGMVRVVAAARAALAKESS